MIAYLIKSTLLLSFLYLPYLLVLRKETFFRFNRLMLLFIIAVSLVVPLMDVHFLAWADTSPVMKALNGTVIVGEPTMVTGPRPHRHCSLLVNCSVLVSGCFGCAEL